MDIEIAANSRTFIVGMTGSGKTYLAKQMLADTPRLVVFNSKDNPALTKEMHLNKATGKNWGKFLRGFPMRIDVRDAPESADRAGYFNEMCRRVRKTASAKVYIDEVLDILGTSFNAEYHVRSLFSKGREAITKDVYNPVTKKIDRSVITSGNIGVVACTQRPSRIPKLMMTEADNIFVFRLQDPDDRDNIAGYLGMKSLPQVADEHGFYYYNRSMSEPVYVPEL